MSFSNKAPRSECITQCIYGVRFVAGSVSFVSCFDLGKGMDWDGEQPCTPSTWSPDAPFRNQVAPSSNIIEKPFNPSGGCCCWCTRLGLQKLHHHSLTRSLTRVKWLHRRYYSYGRGGRVCFHNQPRAGCLGVRKQIITPSARRNHRLKTAVLPVAKGSGFYFKMC